MNRISFSVIVFLASSTISFAGWQSGDPDALDIIMAFEESRTSLKTGKLELLLRGVGRSGEYTNRDYHLAVVFDEEKRHFDQRSGGIILNNSKISNIPDLEAYLRTTSDDHIVKSGVGETYDENARLFFDGRETCVYEPKFGAKQMNSKDVLYFAFDARALGVDPYLRPNTGDLHGFFSLFYNTNPLGKLDFIKSEDLGGQKCWHIHAIAKSANYDYWFDKTDFTKLYKSVTSYNGTRIDVTSSYEDIDHKAPTFPKNVRIRSFDEKNHLRYGWDIVVKTCIFGEKVEPKLFTLSSLRLPYGQRVDDVRSRLISLGYWDGEKLVDHFSTTSPDPSIPVKPKNSWTNLIVVNVFLVLCSFFWIYFRRMRKTK